MPPINRSNSTYEKVSLLDEFEENEYSSKNAPKSNAKMNGYSAKKPESFPTDTRIEGLLTGTKTPLCLESIMKATPYDDDPKFPKEKRKTLFAFIAMVFSFFLADTSIVLTHQKVPDRNLHPPLPDITLDNVTKIRWLNHVADILVILSVIMFVAISILHRHRWIVCRRVCLLLCMLYSLRAVTIYVTVLPLANDHVYCSPKMSETFSTGQKILTIAAEVLQLLQCGGLPVTGKKTMCGDYIYSGHTIMLMMANLLVLEYIPKRCSLIHWVSWIIAWTGMICLLVSHGHYTIDVIVGYYTTTRLFWIYHTFCNNAELKRYRRRKIVTSIALIGTAGLN